MTTTKRLDSNVTYDSGDVKVDEKGFPQSRELS
jgi:hypothetical protein